jgi:ADP-ribose pyrophosphatase
MDELYRDKTWQVLLESAPLPDGRERRVPRVKCADSVHLLAFPENGRIFLIREFRPYYGTYLWMLPSGHVDKEDDAAIGAQRELREETGYRANTLEHLWSVNHSERLIMTNHFFRATDLQKDSLPQDDDELIELHTVSIEEALEKIHSSPKIHLASAYGVMRWMQEHK